MATAHNDEWMANPIFADRALILPSTSSKPHAEPKPKRNIPPAIGRIVGEIGLRYRPSNEQDLIAHAERLRLLTEDIADVPPELLEAAAKRWVRESHFMPKASDLIELSRNRLQAATQGTDYGFRQLQDHCDRLNATNNGRDGWHVVGQAPKRTIAKRSERSAA